MLVPLYTRYLRASEFGVLSLLTITLTLVTIVLKFGLNHAFFRHYYDTDDTAHRRRIVGSTLAFLLVSGVLSTALLYLVAPQVSWLVFSGDTSHADLLRLIFFISFFEIISVIPRTKASCFRRSLSRSFSRRVAATGRRFRSGYCSPLSTLAFLTRATCTSSVPTAFGISPSWPLFSHFP